MKTTAKRSTVIEAIETVNREKGYSITLNRNEQNGKYFFFTLKSKSGIPGSRYNYRLNRKLACASWHAHGYIFDAIFKLDPEAVIYSVNKKITSQYGNWQDENIGSMADPCYFSETSIL